MSQMLLCFGTVFYHVEGLQAVIQVPFLTLFHTPLHGLLTQGPSVVVSQVELEQSEGDLVH